MQRLFIFNSVADRITSSIIPAFHYFREEMEDVVGSVFDLMGRTADPMLEEEVISERVDTIFEVGFWIIFDMTMFLR